MKINKKLIFLRTAIITFYAVCLIFTAYILIKNPFDSDFYGIMAHDKNLFHCPSCGLTRAIYCLLTFNFKDAFYYHAYFTLFFPIIIYTVLTISVNLFFNKKVLPYPRRYPVFLYTLFGILIFFTVLRNFVSVIY